MIYKPTSASPNLEIVTIGHSDLPPYDDGDTSPYSPIFLSGVASSKILNRILLIFSGEGCGLPKDSDNNAYGSYYGIDNKYTNDSYMINVNISIPGFQLFPNIPISWQGRLYEEYSFIEDKYVKDSEDLDELWRTGYLYSESDTNNPQNFPYYQYNNGYRYGMFNYSLAYEDAEKSNPVFTNDWFYATKYFPSSWIGYGSVVDIYNVYLTGKEAINNSNESPISLTSSGNRGNGYKLIRIFPHDFHNWIMFGKNSTTYSDTKKYTTKYDNFYSRYYIKIRGYYFKILDFRYYEWIDSKEKGNASDNINAKDEYDNLIWVDGYGNPLSMYVLIKVPENFEISNGDTYTIYSNYIDTDNYTYEINEVADISFYDKKFSNNEIIFYTNETEALKDSNVFTLKYSNLELEGSYSQSSGAYLSKFNVTLKQIVNGEYKTIDKQIDSFSQTLYYNFDEFRNNEKYLLEFEIVNNRNVIDKRYLCINVFYGVEPKLLKATANYNPSDNSIIIDYSNALSISPKETIEGGYAFKSEDDNIFLCIDKGNNLKYDEIDGVGTLSFSNILANIAIRLHPRFSGEICRIENNEKNQYILSWNGLTFIYSIIDANTSITTKYTYCPFNFEVSDETDISQNPWLAAMISNMTTSAINTSVPYIWNEAFSAQLWNEDLYIHTESPTEEYWWTIVMCNNAVYFYNIDNDTVWHKAILETN